jgi:hypothetical protein
MKTAVLPIAAGVLLLALSCWAETPRSQVTFATSKSVTASLGVQKLDRVNRRSGKLHSSVQELASLLERDADLVSITGHVFVWNWLVVCAGARAATLVCRQIQCKLLLLLASVASTVVIEAYNALPLTC